MAEVPEGAQLSDDGQWWWDGQDWQPVSQEGGSGGDREAARVAQGMPASTTDLTDDHRQGYFAEPEVEVEAVETEEAEVLAMQDAGGSEGSYA